MFFPGDRRIKVECEVIDDGREQVSLKEILSYAQAASIVSQERD